MSKNTNLKVSFLAKIWWILTWAIMIVLLFMLGRNFLGSIVFGPNTKQNEITVFHSSGYSDALSGGEKKEQDELQTNNPLLIKSYNKGYREGLDKKWQEQEEK